MAPEADTLEADHSGWLGGPAFEILGASVCLVPRGVGMRPPRPHLTLPRTPRSVNLADWGLAGERRH